jgi:hypothetical protein
MMMISALINTSVSKDKNFFIKTSLIFGEKMPYLTYGEYNHEQIYGKSDSHQPK